MNCALACFYGKVNRAQDKMRGQDKQAVKKKKKKVKWPGQERTTD
jgi:hypothetical protein